MRFSPEDVAAARRVADYAEAAFRGDVTGDGTVNESDLAYIKALFPAPATIGVVVGPSDDWLGAIAKGGTVILRGGIYKPTMVGLSFHAGLEIQTSGVTVRAYPGEVPILDATGCFWGIFIGKGPHDNVWTPTNSTVIDGLRVFGADREGIFIAAGSNHTVRNCHIYDCSRDANGYHAGIEIWGTATNVMIEYNRVYHNGYGIESYEEDINSATPVGCKRCTIRYNIVYANFATANAGDSAGIGLRFGEHCDVYGNVVYDNPDAGINGLGNVRCKFTGNALLNSYWTSMDANQCGLKTCVRGGGGNEFYGNLIAYNGDLGFDATWGIGDVFANNTVVGSGRWGIEDQGRETFTFNNIVTGSGYKDLAFGNLAAGSGSNQFGPVGFYGPVLSLARLKTVVHPEAAFGVSTAQAIIAKLATAYAPTTKQSGMGIVVSVPQVLAAIDARTAEFKAVTGGPSLQQQQAMTMWSRLRAELTATGYGTIAVTDLLGKTLPTTPIRGCVQ